MFGGGKSLSALANQIHGSTFLKIPPLYYPNLMSTDTERIGSHEKSGDDWLVINIKTSKQDIHPRSVAIIRVRAQAACT